MAKLWSKEISKRGNLGTNECTKSDFSRNLFISYNTDNGIRNVKLYVNELSKLREEGKITDDQMIAVLKYIISFLVEKEITKRVDIALEKQFLNLIHHGSE